MLCACVQSIQRCESQDNTAVTSIYKTFSEKLFYTVANEFIKRDKFLNNRTAQLMLRDKLKFYASSKQDNKKKISNDLKHYFFLKVCDRRLRLTFLYSPFSTL